MINIHNLLIEVTRECNLCCDHCLRGDTEKGTISLDHVHNLFQQIQTVGTITLTGGEPALYPNILIEILNIAKHYQVDINNFYIATNGTIASDEFLISLIKWYSFCTDNEVTCVIVSNDMYHDVDAINNNWSKLSTLRFVHKREKDDYYNYMLHTYEGTMTTLLAEGRSSDCNGRKPEPDKLEITKYGDAIEISEGNVYLNTKGYLLNNCDLSYESQKKDEFQICYVNNLTAWTNEKVKEYA